MKIVIIKKIMRSEWKHKIKMPEMKVKMNKKNKKILNLQAAYKTSPAMSSATRKPVITMQPHR